MSDKMRNVSITSTFPSYYLTKHLKKSGSHTVGTRYEKTPRKK